MTTRSVTKAFITAAVCLLPALIVAQSSAAPRPLPPPDGSDAEENKCKPVGSACKEGNGTDPVTGEYTNNCCSHWCKNFSAGFYCYKTKDG